MESTHTDLLKIDEKTNVATISDEQSVKWQCNTCTLLNPKAVEQCVACLDWKPKTPKLQPDILKASHELNLFHNNAVNDKVSLTSFSVNRVPNQLEREIRMGNAVNGAMFYNNQVYVSRDIWLCPRCTLENQPGKSACIACGEPYIPLSVPVSDEENSQNATINATSNANQRSVEVLNVSAQLNALRKNDNDMWTCSKCTFACNPSWAKVCDVCGVNRNDSSQGGRPVNNVVGNSVSQFPIVPSGQRRWRCEMCTLENDFADVQCKACHNMRNAESNSSYVITSSSSDDNGNWSCNACTFLNKSSAGVCAMCGSKREVRYPSLSDNGFDHPYANVTKELQMLGLCKKCKVRSAGDSQICDYCKSMSNEVSLTNVKFKIMPSKSLRLREEELATERNQLILAFCHENCSQFVDDSFPPTLRSLFYDEKNPPRAHEDIYPSKDIQWLRPAHIQAHVPSENSIKWSVFRTPLPSDVTQGIDGNCWLLSAMAVLAERPSLVEKIFITRDYSPEGVYQLRLCIDGAWQIVVIDDLFPCDHQKRFLYARAKRRQLWVSLIEKALAKAYDCYEALTAGKCSEGMALLTGAPCETISLKSSDSDHEFDKNLIWAKLLSSRESRFLMGASCGSSIRREDREAYEQYKEGYKQLGLRANHAYSVLDVQDVNGYRLIRLRNPWGVVSWMGDWSDHSDCWKEIPAALKEELRPEGADEGIFWMSFEDIMTYFDTIDVCQIYDNEDRMEFRYPGYFPSEVSKTITSMEMELFTTSEVCFAIFQQSLRRRDMRDQNCADICIVITRGGPPGQQGAELVLNTQRQVKRFIMCSQILEAGKYHVTCLAFNNWNTDNKRVRYVLAIYSLRPLIVTPREVSNSVLADAVIMIVMKHGERHEPRDGIVTYHVTSGWSGLMLVVENNTSRYLQVKCDCTGSKWVVSTRGTLVTVDSVPPSNRQVIMLLSQIDSTTGFSITQFLKHRIKNSCTLDDWAPQSPNSTNYPALSASVSGLHQARPFLSNSSWFF